MKRTVIYICILLFILPHAAMQAQEFKRSIELKTFVPKGQWILGNSISYSEHNESNYNFLIIEGINSDGYTFKVSPMLCYAFKDNLAAGGRFSYARTLTKLSGVTINVDDDNQFDLDDMYQLKHSYAVWETASASDSIATYSCKWVAASPRWSAVRAKTLQVPIPLQPISTSA